jgi:hypothetical protein
VYRSGDGAGDDYFGSFCHGYSILSLAQRLPWSGAHGMLNSGESSARWSNCSELARIDYFTVSVGRSRYAKLAYQTVKGLL